MRRSIVLLGRDVQAEREMSAAVGGEAHGFFCLAQRIAWALTAPHLIRGTDVVGAAERLVARYGQQFPAHLFDAWVWRTPDPARADDALERARSLVTPDHPLRYLLPSPREWALERTPQALVEVSEGRIWRVTHFFALAGSPLLASSTGTLLRLKSGELAFLNPVALTEQVARSIDALGPVRWVVSQGKTHSAFINEVQRRFKGSLAIGTEGHLKHKPADHVELDGVLGSYGGLPEELELLPVQGHALEEQFILHRPTRTLIFQDFVGHAGTDQGSAFVSRLYVFAFGAAARFSLLSYSPIMWLDLRALRDSLRRVRDSGFEQILGAHWPVEPRQGEDLNDFLSAIDFTCGFGPIDHRIHLTRYFWSQPGFLRDLARYERANRGAQGARLRGSS